jgi:glycolate oxidase iron-sulfur subunit
MMQQMLEKGGAPSAETVLHVDRCLSCLGCRTACPSGVDYARLVDTARAHIETHYKRPLGERVTRAAVVHLLTRPWITTPAVALARLFAPLAMRLPGRIGAMARVAGKASRRGKLVARRSDVSEARQVALMRGCVQPALAPQIDDAATRSLARRGIALVALRGAGCCGALAHHLGRTEEAKTLARKTIQAFERSSLDKVLITATGCAAHMADYPHLFVDDPKWRARAESFAKAVQGFSEIVEPRASSPKGLRIAYQVPCSQQHGLGRSGEGASLLREAGYEVVEIPEGHLCCGSAGSYSLLQPEIAGALRDRKLTNIATLGVDAIASPNIGCLIHMTGPDAPPIIHPAELIDWAEGGPRPAALQIGKGAMLRPT